MPLNIFTCLYLKTVFKSFNIDIGGKFHLININRKKQKYGGWIDYNQYYKS